MTAKTILVFDFDGVISNSVHDSFRTAINTYIEFCPKHGLPLTRPLNTARDTFRFEKEYPEYFNRFRKIMPLGNRAEDYYVILTILDRGDLAKISNQNNFNAYSRSIPVDEQRAYHALFYQIRRNLQKKDPRDWATLMPIFPGVAEAIAILAKKFVLAIATSKDRSSVDIQMTGYGITKYFQPENILDKDFAENKRAHLTQLHRRHNTPFGQIHFIDDKVLHLVSVKDLGVKCYLAMWGFNTAKERELAKKEGFVLLQLENLTRSIHK